MNDKFERKINYARISLTNICNLKCQYCSQDDGKKKNISTHFYKNLVDALDELGIEKIRFTGGEPLLNKNIVELIEYTGKKKNINDICITTNGILLEQYLDDLIKFGLKRVNISLDTISKENYMDLTGKDYFDVVVKNIILAKSKGLKVKINAVLLKGITDIEIEEFLSFGYANEIEVRFIELMPIGDNIEYFSEKYLSATELLNNVDCKKLDLQKNDVVTYYRYKDKYDFGIISPISNHFCSACNRIRITAEGNLRLCLHSDTEINLLQYDSKAGGLYNVIKESILEKPEKHLISEKQFAKSKMVQIGG